jgi:tetraacyldisaccharide 4'-kinase
VTGARADLESRLRRVWDEGGEAPAALSVALTVASAGYRGALALRERLYRLGMLRSRRLSCPVISIGNLTLGGSGKTPVAALAVSTLQALGARPAVVSRGYGRHSRGLRVVSDRAGIRLRAREGGDEPVLLAERLPGVPVVVGESRYEAGRVAVERLGADAVVVDDGYQHRALHKDLEVLVVGGREPWGNGRLFPRGRLREPLTAIGRAHLVVVTNATATVRDVAATIRRHNDRAPLVSAGYELEGVRRAGAEAAQPGARVAGHRLLAFAGLASPRGFAETVAATGAGAIGLVEFPDHHWYTARELAELAERARAGGAEGLITTEKDWVRIRDLSLPPVALWVVSVSMSLRSGAGAWHEALARVWTSAATPGAGGRARNPV